MVPPRSGQSQVRAQIGSGGKPSGRRARTSPTCTREHGAAFVFIYLLAPDRGAPRWLVVAFVRAAVWSAEQVCPAPPLVMMGASSGRWAGSTSRLASQCAQRHRQDHEGSSASVPGGGVGSPWQSFLSTREAGRPTLIQPVGLLREMASRQHLAQDETLLQSLCIEPT